MSSKFKRLGMSVAVMAAVLAGGAPGPGRDRRQKPTKECLHCGGLHSHNNAYCCSACCELHRSARSLGAETQQ